MRLSAAEERATRAEWERRESVTGLERQLAAARAEVLDWRRELAAAEAERDRLAADKKLLTKRGSSGSLSLYAGYNGTPKARGARGNVLVSPLFCYGSLFGTVQGRYCGILYAHNRFDSGSPLSTLKRRKLRG